MGFLLSSSSASSPATSCPPRPGRGPRRSRPPLRRRRDRPARREHARRDRHAPRRLPALGDGPRPPRHRRRPRQPAGSSRDADRRRRGARRRGPGQHLHCCWPPPPCASEGTDTLEGAHAAVAAHLGSGAALLFAIGLLASAWPRRRWGPTRARSSCRGCCASRSPCCCAAPSPSSPPSCAWGSGGPDPRARRVPGRPELRDPLRPDPPRAAHELAPTSWASTSTNR